MKRTWVIPAMLVAGVAGLGGLTYAASAQNGDGCGSCYMGEGGESGDGWNGQRWRDDDRGDNDERSGNDDGDPRWRDNDDDRRSYGSHEGRRGENDCGPRDRGWGYHGRGYGMHGYGPGRDGMERGYDRREGRGYDRREGRRFDRDDDDRGYRGYGYHHRYHHQERRQDRREGRRQDRQEERQEGRQDGRQQDRQEGRGGPRFGRSFDPARLESAKKEIGVTEAQEQAWTKYATTLKEVAEARKARRESIDRSAIGRMSTEEHRKFRDSMIEQRRKEQDNVNAAVDELIKSFDEKQVAIAREVLPGYAFGPWMRGAGMGMGMGMGGRGNR